MNSIDTFIPTLIPVLESEDSAPVSFMSTPDAAALEALRALMGGFGAPAPAFKAQTPGSDSPTLQKSAAGLPAVLEQLLKADGLPPALLPLLTNLRGKLQKGEAAQSDPALVAEIKTLLRDVAPARPDFGMVDQDGQPFSLSAAQPATFENSPRGVLFSPAGLALHPVEQPSAQGLPVVEVSSGVSPLESSTVPSAAPPADIPTLARALLHMLEDTPRHGGVAGMMAPLLESSASEKFSAPPPPDKPADAQNLGSAILQSLSHQSASTPVQAGDKTASATGAAERVTEVSDLITRMADRVLVTDPLHGRTQEVRIKIADNVMQGTEVRVWREDGGALRVEFDTTSAYWSRILNEASPLLSQRLNERLPSGTEAQVTVQPQGQQPQDGRSRNRHNPWELAQQAQEA